MTTTNDNPTKPTHKLVLKIDSPEHRHSYGYGVMEGLAQMLDTTLMLYGDEISPNALEELERLNNYFKDVITCVEQSQKDYFKSLNIS